MKHDEAIKWLFSLHRFGMKLGLDNIRILTEALGRPQDRFESVLIAGTNGKGSTAAMLHSILVSAGIRSGLYTSPHLVRTEERIRIGASDIDPDDLASLLGEIRITIEDLLRDGRLTAHPTFFEAVTAAAFVTFARARVEIAVLEVGLGGRFDATNIVSPVLSVITGIDLDHKEQLGETLEAIAREKAGILRFGTLGLVGERRQEPLGEIREEAKRIGAPLIEAWTGSRIRAIDPREGSRRLETPDDPDAPGGEPRDGRLFVADPAGGETPGDATFAEDPTGGGSPNAPAFVPAPSRRTQTIALTTPVRRYSRFECPLLGSHQLVNVLTAVRAAEILSAARPAIDARAIASGIAAARWPGRLEWVAGEPPLLLDGAHNPSACRALADYLEANALRSVLVFAAMRDKDAAGMLETLVPRVRAAIFTKPRIERAAEPAALKMIAGRFALGSKLARGAIAPGADRSAGPGVASRDADAASRVGDEARGAGSRSRSISADAPLLCENEVATAIAAARRLARPGETILVAGSLFLVGAVKEILEGNRDRRGGS